MSISDGTDADSDGIRTANGDILVRAATSILFNAQTNSLSGDVGILAGDGLTLNSSLTTNGDVLLRSVGTMAMSAASVVDAGRQIAVRSGSGLSLVPYLLRTLPSSHPNRSLTPMEQMKSTSAPSTPQFIHSTVQLGLRHLALLNRLTQMQLIPTSLYLLPVARPVSTSKKAVAS